MMVVSVRRATGFVGDGEDWRNASIVSLTARACGAPAFAASRAVAPISLTGRPTSVAADARPAKALEGGHSSPPTVGQNASRSCRRSRATNRDPRPMTAWSA